MQDYKVNLLPNYYPITTLQRGNNMEHIYFKGLEKSLNDGCYIKVFSCSMRYSVVRVEKKI